MSDDAHRALVSERVALQRRQTNTEKKKPVVSAPTPMKKKKASPEKKAPPPAATPPVATTTGKTAATSVGGKASRKSAAQLDKERQQAMVPCRYFSVNGQCNQGAKCPYSHNPDLLGIFGGGSGTQSNLFGGRGGAAVAGGGDDATPNRRRRGPKRSNSSSNDPDALDIDRLDYEQLTALCDSMGTVKVGFDKAKLEQLPCVVLRTATTEKCSVCQEVFAMGDKMKILPCSHPFHPDCIDEWLDASKKCPNCNEEINFGVSAFQKKEKTSEEGEGGQARRGYTPPPATGCFSSAPNATGNVATTHSSSSTSSGALPPIHQSPPQRTTSAATLRLSGVGTTPPSATRPPLVFRNVQDVMAALEDCP